VKMVVGEGETDKIYSFLMKTQYILLILLLL